MIGSGWAAIPRATTGELNKLVRHTLPASKLPSLMAPETPDTPRAVMRIGGVPFAKVGMFVSFFLPQGIPMINSGIELLEKQPMNLGLDAKESDRFVLDKHDPNYGKLAYFDATNLHWLNESRTEMIDLITQAAAARKKDKQYFRTASSLIQLQPKPNNPSTLLVGYGAKKTLRRIFAANFSNTARRLTVTSPPDIVATLSNPLIIVSVTSTKRKVTVSPNGQSLVLSLPAWSACWIACA